MSLEIRDHGFDVTEVVVALSWLSSILKLLRRNLIVASVSNEVSLAIDVLLLISLFFREEFALHRRVVGLIGRMVAYLRIAHTEVCLSQLLLHGSGSVCIRPVHSAEVFVVG